MLPHRPSHLTSVCQRSTVLIATDGECHHERSFQQESNAFSVMRGDNIMPISSFTNRVSVPRTCKRKVCTDEKAPRPTPLHSSVVDDCDQRIFCDRLVRWVTTREGCWVPSSTQIPSETIVSGDVTMSETLATIHALLCECSAHVVLQECWVPQDLWDVLFPHQQQGLIFLWSLHTTSEGCVIADEMGLGKTAQMIAFLGALHFTCICNSRVPHHEATSWTESHGDHAVLCCDALFLRDHPIVFKNALVVCPATVVHHWLAEIHKWYPAFRCLTIWGKTPRERRRTIKISATFGCILVMSYEALRNDATYVQEQSFSYVILDEGQKIRNPEAHVAIAVKKLKSKHRIILSGTPIQNDLREVWALFDFVAPQRLGTLSEFTNTFANAIQSSGLATASQSTLRAAHNAAAALRSIISPYFLRRTKREITEVTSLPNKSELILFCTMSTTQFQIYSEFIKSQHGFLSKKDAWKHLQSLKSYVFFALSVLRKICNHPDLLLLGQVECRSGKLHVALQILTAWHENHHRVLVFSQSVQMINILLEHIVRLGYTCRRIDGGTPMRQRHVILEEFNKDTTIFVLLMTTRVGGVGLNLTAANRVLIYDPDWNPMTDAQAKERSWRMGQTKDVIVYRLIVAGTIEEKIYQRQIFKHFLSQNILTNAKQRRYFKMHDLYALFELPRLCQSPSDVSMDVGKEVHPPCMCIIQYMDQWGRYQKDISYEKSLGVTSEDDDLENGISLKYEEQRNDSSVLTGDVSNKIKDIPIPKLKRPPASSCHQEQQRPMACKHQPGSTLQRRIKRKRFPTIEAIHMLQDAALLPPNSEVSLITTLLATYALQGFLSHDRVEYSPGEGIEDDPLREKTQKAKCETPQETQNTRNAVVETKRDLYADIALHTPTTHRESGPQSVSLLDWLKQRGDETEERNVWKTKTHQKLRTFFTERGPSTTESILKVFEDSVVNTPDPDLYKHEFKTLLKQSALFDVKKSLWVPRLALCDTITTPILHTYEHYT